MVIEGVVLWNCSGARGTLIYAEYEHYRFDVYWPDRDFKTGDLKYDLIVFYDGEAKLTQPFPSLHKAIGWILESCKDLALSKDTDWKHC